MCCVLLTLASDVKILAELHSSKVAIIFIIVVADQTCEWPSIVPYLHDLAYIQYQMNSLATFGNGLQFSMPLLLRYKQCLASTNI